MNEFIRIFDKWRKVYDWEVKINYCNITKWNVSVYSKSNKDKPIVLFRGGDFNLVMANAQIQIKEWLIKHNNGY